MQIKSFLSVHSQHNIFLKFVVANLDWQTIRNCESVVYIFIQKFYDSNKNAVRSLSNPVQSTNLMQVANSLFKKMPDGL